MAVKKAPAATIERVHSKSFNGARRGTVLERRKTDRADSFFGDEFALVRFDHLRDPLWSATKWLKKPTKADLYERWRADPRAAIDAVAQRPTEEILQMCARISTGVIAYYPVVWSHRWAGLVSELSFTDGTDALLRLLERLLSDESARGYDEPLTPLDGTEYHKSELKNGRVQHRRVCELLRYGIEWHWRSRAERPWPTTADAIGAGLAERFRAACAQLGDNEAALLAQPLEPLASTWLHGGCSREYNARCGLDDTYAMINGTGY
jgi:hypothetical protein